MPTLYIANRNYSSWSLRPWLRMRELGVAFDEVLVPFGGPEDPHDFGAFSPSGKVPCLVDGDAVVWDSLAIVEYLAEGAPGAWPADRLARAWARSASAEMHAGFAALRGTCTMNCGLRVRLHALPAALGSDLARIDALWRDGLVRFGGPFLAGPGFTAVDACFAPVAFRLQTYGLALSPDADAYAARLLALPGMRDWYALALQEPWRELAHEAELREAGEVTADLRRAPGG